MLVTQSCPTLGNLMDCNLPGSPVHGMLQARILEQAAIPFSRGSSGPKDQTQVFCISASLVTQMVKKSYYMIQQFHFWVFIWRKQKTVIQKDKCTPVFIVELFTIAKKQPVCPSIDEWKKMLYTCTKEYYSAIKSEILPFVTTWMDLEGIMLGELNLTEKNKYSMTWLVCQL